MHEQKSGANVGRCREALGDRRQMPQTVAYHSPTRILVPQLTDHRVVVLLRIIFQKVFHRKGRQCPPAPWEEANKKSEEYFLLIESKLKATVQGPRGNCTILTIFVMMDGCCISIKKRGNNFDKKRGNSFETTHWTGIYPVSVFAC
eukprot:scaffold28993_cov65-Attheya_sp.AAC.4